jgi:hypothetical protein
MREREIERERDRERVLISPVHHLFLIDRSYLPLCRVLVMLMQLPIQQELY